VQVKYPPALHCGAGNPEIGSYCPEWAGVIRFKKGINLPSRDRRIGFLFQNYASSTCVAQNIAFGLQQMPKPQRDRQVNEQLRVQLQGLGRYPPAVRWSGRLP